MTKSIFILYSYLIFPSSLPSLFYVQHCYSNTSFLESLGQFSLSLILFFFNYALLFVSLGSIITHFIHLLPTHSTAMLFLKEHLCFLPRPCSFSRAASEIIWLLKWRVGKGGRLQGPQLKAALAFFDIYGQPDYDD